jgi:hypothetical protein
MRALIPLCCLLALLAALPRPAFAWGQNGHRAIGHIAEQHLTEEVRYTVRQLLDGDSLAEASTWADEIKSDRDWNYASPWHYVNVEDDETYATAPKSPGGDAIEAIARMRATLKDRSQPRRKRVEALKFLIHLVGDLHQPMHFGRRSDRGGNDVKVRWFGKETNLHAVWDSDIIQGWELSYRELADMVDIPDAATRAQWGKAPVLQWAEESFAYRKQVYEIGDGDLGYRYAYVHGPFLKQRIAQAGIRLAAVLNQALRR